MNESHQATEDEFSANPLVAFMDRVERLPDTIKRRQTSYELLQMKKGSHIADIGCGAGTAVFEMDALVRPDGSIAGIDINEGMIVAARGRAERRGIRCNLQVGDAATLPFADESLNGYRAERLYQHLSEPAKFLKEAYRVLAPNGHIVLVDQDWDSVLIDSHDLKATRAIARVMSDGIRNSAVGRQYYRLLKDAGFVDVHVVADTHVSTNYEHSEVFIDLFAQIADVGGILNSDQIQAWRDEQKNRAENGRFFMAMTHFIGVGRR